MLGSVACSISAFPSPTVRYGERGISGNRRTVEFDPDFESGPASPLREGN